MLKLRMSLLAHRSAQTSQFSLVVAYAEEGCNMLNKLSSAEAQPKDSPPRSRGKKTGAKARSTGIRLTTGRGRSKAAKTATAVPVTPKRKTGELNRSSSVKSILTLGRLGRPTSVAISHVITPKDPELASRCSFDGMPQLADLLRKNLHGWYNSRSI